MPDVEDLTTAQINEMRQRVLAAALALAVRAIDLAEQEPGASVVQLKDSLAVHTDGLDFGVTWNLTAQWDRDDNSVTLRGGPTLPEEAPRVMGPFLVFGGPDSRGQIAYSVPAPWVRATAAAYDPRTA